MAHWIDTVTHLACTYSDHSPVKLSLMPPVDQAPFARWRLNPAHLLDLEQEIQDFFTRNVESVPSLTTVWEAFKVMIRGWCISKGGGVLKDIRRELDRLEKDIKNLERGTANKIRGEAASAELRDKLTEYTETAELECKF